MFVINFIKHCMLSVPIKTISITMNREKKIGYT